MHKNRWLSFLIWILVLALLGGAVWYFFILNHDAAAAIWERVGNFYNENGIYDSAAKCYGRSIKNDPECGTELLYKASTASKEAGNYTKAEYYLALSIQNYPQELESYLRLSSLFVEEDKLMDAVELIDNCATSMSSALESLRPDSPVIQPEAPYSLEPVTVTLSFSEGNAYYSLGSDYPSIASGRYEEGFDLDYGTTKVSALIVGDNGLVSKLSSTEFTVRGVISELDIADTAMDEIIRETIGAGRYDLLTTDMLWDIEKLELSSSVNDYSVLSNCISLRELSVSNDKIDFSLFENCSTLESLDCSDIRLSQDQLLAIGNLTGLKKLDLSNCGLTDIACLSSLNNLEIFNLAGNHLSDLSPLSGMSGLLELDISGNSVSSLSALTGLSSLTSFNGCGCRFGNLGAFAANTDLVYLNVEGCGVSDLSPLENNLKLNELHAAGNLISFVDSLSNCRQLEYLDLSDNRVESIEALSGLSKLTYLNVSSNQLTELPSFASLTEIMTLDISENEIESISCLSVLNKLNTLNISKTLITEISPVTDLANIVSITANECEIHDPENAVKRSIILTYDPGYELPVEEEEEETETEDE